MTRFSARLAVLLVSGVLGGWLVPGIGTGQAPDSPSRLTDVSVESAPDGATVRIKTSGPLQYEASLIDSPTRLLIDFRGTVYAWPKSRMGSDVVPVKEIRGSQFRVGVARVVVEMTRSMTYRIDEGPDGLVIALQPSAASAPKSTKPLAAAPAAKHQEPPVVVSEVKSAPLSPDAPKLDAPKLESPKLEAPKAAAPKPAPVAATPAPLPEPKPVTKSSAPKPEPVVLPAPAPSAPVAPVVVDAKRPVAPEAPAPALAPLAKPETLLVAQASAPAADASAAPAAESRTPAPLPSPFVGQARPGTPAPPGAPPAVAPDGSKLISLDFKDADVLNLLRILAAEGGRNIVAGDDVRGKISVSLRNVTWEQALDTVLEVRGLAKIEKGNVIRVVSIEQLTKEREAQVRVEDARRRADAETRTKFAEAQLKEEELATKRFALKLAEEETIARGPLREETIRLAYAEPIELARTLRGILGMSEEEGTMQVPIGAVPYQAVPADPTVVPSSGTINPALGRLPQPNAPLLSPPGTGQAMVSVSQDVLVKGITIRSHKPTNSIFIRHYEKDLERIKKLVREHLDVPLPQVKIEARMEILDRNSLEAIGVQWGGSYGPKKVGDTVVVGSGFTQPQDPAAGTLPAPAANRNLVNLPFQLLPNAASQIPAAGIAFGIIGTNFNLNLALQALATQGKTRTLARPEIVTVENSKATVSLGEEIPYATVSSAGTQIQFKEALLKLDVTPTVIRERINNQEVRKIKMMVVVENNSRGDIVNLGAGGTPPAINRRKAETQVLIKEGDRLVIGGVTQATQSNAVRKVPIMGDIPILGWLFRSHENLETGRELVVFVTPTLLLVDNGLAAR